MNYNVLYASQFLMQHSGTIRIWPHNVKTRIPPANTVGEIFLAHLSVTQ